MVCSTGELVTFTSGAGMGKSSIIRELMHHVMSNTKDNIGVLAMEENIRNTAFNLMSVEANQRLYIKEIRDQVQYGTTTRSGKIKLLALVGSLRLITLVLSLMMKYFQAVLGLCPKL